MLKTQRRISLKVFDAASDQLRIQILRTINTQGAIGYVEIMSQLKLNPRRDAGKFAYHLRMLRQAGLLDMDKTTKKYKLSSLGVMVLNFSQDVEEHALRERGKLLVRTSRLAMEDFDRNKIVQSLTREAGVPLELAQKVAEETEERLIKLDTLYLTAPLIREFVNAVLIERGLQEYRHKLTRLGLPVYDITQLMKKVEISRTDTEWIDRLMGRNVMTEYVLLNSLPREVADAHLSGQIHLSNIDMWVLKPDNFQHDLRVFLRKGLASTTLTSMAVASKPPQSIEDALMITNMILYSSGIEVANEQGINHFNLFLAPFTLGVSSENLKEALKRFFINLNHSISNKIIGDVSLGFDFSPKYLENVKAVGLDGNFSGVYDDYFDESLRVLETILDLLLENYTYKPLFYPHLIFRVEASDFKKKEIEPLLLKAHMLAARFGTPYFVNLLPEWQKNPVYFATGVRLSSDWTGDWELDTMRTGSIGMGVINLPRLAYATKENDKKFFTELDNSINIVVEALKIRYGTIRERLEGASLPFLSQKEAEEQYLRMKNTSLLIGTAGLNETVKVFTGRQIYEEKKATDFAMNIVSHLAQRTEELSRKYGLRIAVSQSTENESLQRLAELDVEKFGWGTVFTKGERTAPYYTDTVAVPMEADISLRERLRIDGYFHKFLSGGHLTLIELEDTNLEALFKLTREICQTNVGAYAFTRTLGYCYNCQKVFYELAQKCPECKTERGFVHYSRLSSKYLPLELWPSAKRKVIEKRIRYRLA